MEHRWVSRPGMLANAIRDGTSQESLCVKHVSTSVGSLQQSSVDMCNTPKRKISPREDEPLRRRWGDGFKAKDYEGHIKRPG